MDEPNVHPSGILVAIAHWRSEADARGGADAASAPSQGNRSQLLAECIDSVLAIDVDRIVVAVLTNAPEQTSQGLASHYLARASAVPVRTLPNVAAFKGPFIDQRQVFSIGWRPNRLRSHGFYLTWAHKGVFRHGLEDPGFSHFVYLEDDISFTAESFSYWCRFREPLATYGLLPGFVRYESMDGASFVVDQVERQTLDRPSVLLRPLDSADPSASDLVFLGLDNPYQGMYVLDRSLATDHFSYSPARTPVRSRSISDFGTRERAAIGPILDDVPPGYKSRNVVPVRQGGAGTHCLDPSCLIAHLAGNYSSSVDSPFGKIKVENLYLE